MAKHDLRLKTYKRLSGLLSFADGASLFSEVVYNKLRLNVKSKITLICAKFGANTIYISKVASCKNNVAAFFLAYPVDQNVNVSRDMSKLCANFHL